MNTLPDTLGPLLSPDDVRLTDHDKRTAGLPDALPSKALTRALQIVSAGWLTVCAVQFVIWLVLAGFGHIDWPWWLWSDIGLGVPVALLWWTHESYHRKSQLVASR